MKGDIRCAEGRLLRHDPQHDDPYLETDVGECPDCSGDGCGDDGEAVPKPGRSSMWFGAGQPDWADKIAHELAMSISAYIDQSDVERVCRLTGGIAYSVAAALREAEKRGAAEENARIYHTKEIGSGSTGPRT